MKFDLAAFFGHPATQDALKLMLPILAGGAAWIVQTLATRAWNEYEIRRSTYSKIIELIDSLFSSGKKEDRHAYLRAVRTCWLVGSDEVVRAGNALTTAIKSDGSQSTDLEKLYSEFVAAMRTDLKKRRWLPPSKTSLTASDFPIEGPGAA